MPKKVSQYNLYADRCRVLARAAKLPEHTELLLKMAAAWDFLAQGRTEFMTRHARLVELEAQLSDLRVQDDIRN